MAISINTESESEPLITELISEISPSWVIKFSCVVEQLNTTLQELVLIAIPLFCESRGLIYSPIISKVQFTDLLVQFNMSGQELIVNAVEFFCQDLEMSFGDVKLKMLFFS